MSIVLHVIYWPTASGKTAQSLDLAESIGGAIISVDARQIYQGLDIATGKIPPADRRGIVHYGLDMIAVGAICSALDFSRQARLWIEGIISQGKIPILCGGTGLYLDAVLLDQAMQGCEPNWPLREELETYAQKEGTQALYSILQREDPLYAPRIHPSNIHAVIRGIEVMRMTGKSKMESFTGGKPRYDIIWHTPFGGDREGLKANISRRVDGFFTEGIVEETRGLLEKGYNGSEAGFDSIGYREVIALLRGEIDETECKRQIKHATWQYAKRQITWCKRYPYNSEKN